MLEETVASFVALVDSRRPEDISVTGRMAGMQVSEVILVEMELMNIRSIVLTFVL